jgi:hypothetical protein
MFCMKKTAHKFLYELDAEDRAFSNELKSDTVGVGFLTAIKEFDFYHYNYTRSKRNEETDLHFYLMRLGIPRLISGVLSGIERFKYPMVTFRSEPLMIRGALEAIAAFGFIEQGRRFAHAALAGECEIHQINERQYEIILPDVVINMEQHEAEVEHHYARLQRERIDVAIRETFAKNGWMERIETLLSKNVRVFRDNFIGYDAHPDLDDFFFGVASSELQTQRGFDTFNPRLQFGGVTMQKYMLALTYFLSLALKHEAFAAALLKKSDQIRLRDILTITCDKKEFCTSLIAASNMYGPTYEGYTPLTNEEAHTILRVLSVRRDNLSILASTMAALPYLIEFSDTAWVKSTAGIQLGAVDYLLDSLRYNFPADYDRHQQRREGSMQRALMELLDDFIPALSYIKNVKIRRGGKIVTDIDLVVIEEATGEVILFQLKHQDHYGGDMRRRSNRAGRLRNESASWLSAVREWLKLSSPTEIRSALQIKASFILQTPRIMLLTRHFAHFLSQLEMDNDAAYATWMQFYDALNRLRAEGKPLSLSGLFGVLQSFMSHKTVKGYELDLIDNYHLQQLSYRIRSSTARL